MYLGSLETISTAVTVKGCITAILPGINHPIIWYTTFNDFFLSQSIGVTTNRYKWTAIIEVQEKEAKLEKVVRKLCALQTTSEYFPPDDSIMELTAPAIYPEDVRMSDIVRKHRIFLNPY